MSACISWDGWFDSVCNNTMSNLMRIMGIIEIKLFVSMMYIPTLVFGLKSFKLILICVRKSVNCKI